MERTAVAKIKVSYKPLFKLLVDKNMRKKLISFMMVTVMAISALTGCGGKETGSVTTDGSTSMEKLAKSYYRSYFNFVVLSQLL